MKFLTYLEGDRERVGVLSDDGARVHPLAEFADMTALIETYPGNKAALAQKAAQPGGVPLEKVTLQAPIPQPRHDLICVGQNYLKHAMESAKFKGIPFKKAEQPVYFGKRVNRALGNGEAICSHRDFTDKLDYEVELGVVIGRRCDHIKADEVFNSIFGYTIINDVSARDVQFAHDQFFFGKSLDGFTPIGPWIVTADEFANPPHLQVKSRINGETRQDDNTEDFLFDIPYLVSQLSRGIVLEPGDMIATGTPAGVGMGFEPPKYIGPGDVVECEIEGIGILRNPVK